MSPGKSLKSAPRAAFPLGSVLRAQGVSARELARRLGCDYPRVRELVRGHTLPSWRVLLAVAAALDVPLCAFDPTPPKKRNLPHVH